NPVEVLQIHGSEILIERRQILRKRSEDDAVALGDRQPLESVITPLEVLGHSAELPHAIDERYAAQISFAIVRPLVVRAHEETRVAELLPAELHATVRAPV